MSADGKGTGEEAFAARLLDWFETEGRKDLPWQRNPRPYGVWVSEIMLQQTQVATVIPYYRRFMGAFPDVRSLADAPLDEVLAHWAGLGYYARARNLHRAAGIVRDRHGGEFPRDFDSIAALPGIGRSTAGAIAALSFGERRPILDGNAKRVLARYHGIPGWPGRGAVAKRLWALADAQTPSHRCADYTQAIMDLGATVCTRARPACERCPLASGCRARDEGRVSDYPGRREARQKPQRRTRMLLVHGQGGVYLLRRPPTGIWGGLWSLPELAEGDDVTAWCLRRFRREPVAVTSWPVLRHSFSHYHLDIEPLAVRILPDSRSLTDDGAAPGETAAVAVGDSDGAAWHSYGRAARLGLAAPVARLIAKLAGTNTEGEGKPCRER